jgi:hypothetical protein
MIGDILAGLIGEAAFGRLGRSQRAQVVFRVGFGLLGASLGIAGAVHFARRPEPITNLPMHASMLAVFVFFACFWLFNVAMLRRWRWPGVGFVVSFVALFATRIFLGP